MTWWKWWLKRIRWAEACPRNCFSYAINVREDRPTCWCGRQMVARAGYVLGTEDDWQTYECPADRPWNFWRHSPWTTVRDARAIVRWIDEQKVR